MTRDSFFQPLTVVVPVFNASSQVTRLVNSLEEIYPEPTPLLSFLFSDDASTEKECSKLYRSKFFQRPDVRLFFRKTNEGFVKNVNSVFRLLRKEKRKDDIVLLNSDTRIFHRVFERLQDAAYSESDIATVTPFTNNGTVASLFSFPNGVGSPSYLSPIEIADLVYENAWGPKTVDCPSGVGFCMYVRWEAILDTGIFDESFGRGYGEETDWCRRALHLGWKHKIHPHAYVEHEGAASFGKEAWEKKAGDTLYVLCKRYPDFAADYEAFCDEDRLKAYRITLALESLERAKVAKAISLFVLHIDPQGKLAMGTERYSRRLQKTLSEEGIAVIEIFPWTVKGVRLRGRFNGETFLQTDFHLSSLGSILSLIRPYTRYLHVHHFLNWPDSAVKEISECDFDSKIVTAHDYYLACPSYNFINAQGEYCGIEKDKTVCNRCYVTVNGGNAAISTEEYRKKSTETLSRFDTIHFPSITALLVMKEALGGQWERLAQKAKVLEHDLSHLYPVAARYESAPLLSETESRHVVFLGSLKSNKGSELLVRSLGALKESGFTVEAFGFSPESSQNPEGLKVTPYRDAEHLAELFSERRPGMVLIPSIWPETFCFTFFESILLTPHAVPVVAPFGYPALVVNQEKLGVVLADLTPEALVAACVQATERRTLLLENKRAFAKKITDSNSPYVTGYTSLARLNEKRPSTPAKLTAEAMAEWSEIYLATWRADQVLVKQWEAEKAGHKDFWKSLLKSREQHLFRESKPL